MTVSFLRVCATSFFALLVHAQTLRSQWQSSSGPATATLGAVVGSDMERYLRALTLAGIIKPLPWGARPFGADELAEFLNDSSAGAHPWSVRTTAALAPRGRVIGSVYTSVNSGFPWGANDGPMWQGRGLTAAAGAAATFRWGPVTAVAAPVIFSSQNLGFPTLPVAGNSPYRDGLFPTIVDRPQRMGSKPYARVSPGESSVRLRAHDVVLGVSTGSLGWGTGETFPAIFGSNAGGFSHLFLGTAGRGLKIPGIGRVSARYVLGVLEQSPWSPVEGSSAYVNDIETGTRRVGSGLTVSWMPAAIPSLELGASRFYHTPFTAGGDRWKAWNKPLEGIFKTSRADVASPGDSGPFIDNQLAAFFARLTFPKRGIEAAFELLRDDHNYDARDLAQEPENNGAITASVRSTFRRTPTSLGVLTLEYFNGDISPIAQQRLQGSLYTHQPVRQGHTERGQLLGSPVGVGAVAGTRAAVERFTTSGAWRGSLQRWRTRSLRSSDPEGGYRPVGFKFARSHDWVVDASVGTTHLRRHQSWSADAGVAWAGVWAFGDPRTNWYARFGWSGF